MTHASINNEYPKQIPWSNSLLRLADRFGDDVAISDGAGRQLTYRQMCDKAHALATRLRGLGMRAGQPVGVLLPNSLEAVWVSYGIRLCGAAETPLSWSSTPDELQWAATIASLNWVVSCPERADGLCALGLTPLLLDSVEERRKLETFAAVPAELPGRILLTSGTTGKPKGVLYRHGARYVGEQLLKATLPFIPVRGERILLMTPFVHGASLLTYAWCDAGAEVVLLDGVDIDRIRLLLNQGSLTAIFAPPTVLAKMTAAYEGIKFSGVKCIFTGTQPLSATIYNKACEMFGPVVRVTYGKSECVNPITVLDSESTHAYFSSDEGSRAGACVGWPAPGVEIRIATPEPVDNHQEHDDGEIMLRAPQMSSGLLTPAGFMPHGDEGWHATGDLGYFDPRGRLMLTGRIADVIKTGGYRVNPDEIEALVTGMSQCGQVCVTSVPSDYWGEVIVAVAEQAQVGWVQQVEQRVSVLSRHKRPRIHLELPELARNPQGKVSRRQVSAEILRKFVLNDGPYPTMTALAQ